MNIFVGAATRGLGGTDGSINDAPVRPAVPTDRHSANVQYIAGEDVLLLAVVLPSMSAAQRRAAIGFAIEDHLAQSLDKVHVTLGPQMSGGHWLVAVVAQDVLAQVSLRDGHRLLPDTLSVPVPAEGWAVLAQPDRALVRLPDGTGFAAGLGVLTELWQMAGSPGILSYGGPLPEGMIVAATATFPEAPDPVLARFDLMAGQRKGRAFRLPRWAEWTLGLGVTFFIGHLMIAAVDMVALTRIEGARADQLRAVLAAAGRPAGEDLGASLSRVLVGQDMPAQGGFLDLSARVFAAMSVQAGQVSVGELRYRAAQNNLVMTLEAANLETLQQIERGLIESGLSVESGAATTRDGAAEVEMTVRGAGS